MHTVRVKSEHEYDVVIGCDWKTQVLQAINSHARVAFVYPGVMRDKVKQMAASDCEMHFFEIPEGESAKSTQTLQSLWTWLGAAGFTRSDLIIGIGGGTTTDLAGFCRGIMATRNQLDSSSNYSCWDGRCRNWR